MNTATARIDEGRLQNLLGTMVTELGAAAAGALIVVGDSLGLYKSLATQGPATSGELGARTGTAERYVREWLASQAASGYIDYDPETRRFSMTAEQAAVFADDDSPALMTGGYYSVTSIYRGVETLIERFRDGAGIQWGDHDGCLFCGVAKFFRPSYKAGLVNEWLPALEGVVPKLQGGARVADVGCGYGSSTIIMAQTFPQSEFIGYDFHEHSIEHARAEAAKAGVKNIRFEVATAKDYPGHDYDLVTFFDCLHDMGDPAGAARHVRETLADDGAWMLVEPMAGDDLGDNLNPVGRAYYAFSTSVCTPTSLSQEVGTALGAQAGERRLCEIIETGGFSRVRRAAQTPFNMILEARP
ncbi:MAG: class I SAM-dependent methyltransferase [Pseudomonadota bacterium]